MTGEVRGVLKKRNEHSDSLSWQGRSVSKTLGRMGRGGLRDVKAEVKKWKRCEEGNKDKDADTLCQDR